jgi:hypothetical protein
VDCLSSEDGLLVGDRDGLAADRSSNCRGSNGAEEESSGDGRELHVCG